MCDFFSCVLLNDGRILWTNSDSHHDILSQTDIEDDDIGPVAILIECNPSYDYNAVDVYEFVGWDMYFDSPFMREEWVTNEMLKRIEALAAVLLPLEDSCERDSPTDEMKKLETYVADQFIEIHS